MDAPRPKADGILEPETEVDGFRIIRLRAEGAMGQVYLAQDLSLGRRVALKFIRAELLTAGAAERFLEEARTTARFNHPHIVTVYATGSFGGRPYLALEYLDGESLRQRLSRRPFATTEALRHCQEVADAIAEAHRHGVVHADLKPENLVLPRDGRIRVVDFGLARYAGMATGAASGTPAYMAPERWRGGAPTPAIDVWSIGVMLHEFLDGHRPLSDAEVVQLAFSPRPPPLSPAVAALPCAELLRSCLAIDPDRRPTAEAVAAALSELLLDSAAPRSGDRSPFRGLRPFTEDDAADFFGRDAEIDAFTERLRHEGLVPLVGPSGIGKSSFIEAGIVPRLRQGEPWSVLTMRPGHKPLSRLAAELNPQGAAELAKRLAERPGELVVALRRCAAERGGKVLLAIDAFEEAFTLASAEEAAKLAACLAAAAFEEERWRIVVALRDDYLGQLARLEALQPFVRALFVLGPLTSAALEEAVTAPLRRVGYHLDDPALVKRIAAGVEAQRAGLPLLQFACMALWERRDSAAKKLLSSVYDEMGGVGGALVSHAQRMLLHLVADEVRVARALLLGLVTAEGTRRPRVQRELLDQVGEAGPKVLEKLVHERLLAVARDPQTDEPFVELAHESLALTWPDLARWLDETREERALVQEIDQAAQLWEKRGRRVEETWEGDSLGQAYRKVQAGELKLATRSREFLEAGLRRSRRTQRRRRALLVGTVVGLSALTIGSALAAVAFARKEQEAVRQQEQIRLAAGDVGKFQLVLEGYDWDPAALRWNRVPLPQGVEWTLAPEQDGAAGPDYAFPELHRGGPHVDPEGRLVETLEAPSRPAVLSIRRGECAPSEIRLRHLPGFTDREGPRRELMVPVPSCATTRAGMVEVPAGQFWNRDDEGNEELIPLEGFLIDRTEVTNEQFGLYEKFAKALIGEVRQISPNDGVYAHARDVGIPVTGINAFQAEHFCQFLGKSLPTRAQWRKAFRGGLTLDAAEKIRNLAPQRMWVWITRRALPPANLDGPDSFPTMAPVGSFPEDVSPYGVLDMAGNVAEWTSTTAEGGNYKGLREVAGGEWEASLASQHESLAWDNRQTPYTFNFGLGFRCAASPR